MRMALLVLSLTIAICGAQTNSIGLPKDVLERRSQFVVRAKGARDPFFPDSSRYGEVIKSPKNSVAPTIEVPVGKPEDLLVLKGISGSGNRKFALINGQILSAGEEAYVRTGAGLAKVKCLKISDTSVVLTVNDEPATKELRLREGP